MSETKQYFGKVKNILRTNNIEDECKKLAQNNGLKELPEYYSSWEELVRDNLSDKYVIINNENDNYSIYEIIENKEDNYSDITYVSKEDPKNPGTRSFIMKFYNGGTCLSECLEESLKKIEENDKNDKTT